MIGWARKRSCCWVAIVLPALLLRALIPLGFMPMFGPGLRVQLTLCEGYAPVPSTAMDMSMDMPMDMPMGVPPQHHPGGAPSPRKGSSPVQQDHRTCPYGASPVLASVPALTILPVTEQRSPEAPTSAPQVAHFEIAPRAQSPRGPPVEV